MMVCGKCGVEMLETVTKASDGITVMSLGCGTEGHFYGEYRHSAELMVGDELMKDVRDLSYKDLYREAEKYSAPTNC